MTAPNASTAELLALAEDLGCVGVELRNDLARPLFDNQSPGEVASLARQHRQRMLGLAEVKAFNMNTEARVGEITALVQTAADCGAEGVALIPAVQSEAMEREAQKDALRETLPILQPILQSAGLMGFIEPLGFVQSSLRFKEDVDAVLIELGNPTSFAIVHDTFHHHLAGEEKIYADRTTIVHVSGVTNAMLAPKDMTDDDRVLVDASDCLNNIAQLRALCADGYAGPISFEAFAPEIHEMKDPSKALAGSIAFINAQLADVTAGAA